MPVKGLKWLALACLIGGIALLAYSASTGATEAGFFFIVPVVIGSGLEAFAGTLLIIAGLFLGMAHLATAYAPAPAEPAPTAEPPEAAGPPVKTGGVVLLGPIPIVFGSDRKITTAMLAMAILLVLLLISFFLFVRP